MIKLKELLNEASPLRRNITDTFKDLDKKFPKKFPSSQIYKVADYIMNKYDIYENPLLKDIPYSIADAFYEYKRGKMTIKRAITGVISQQRGYRF
jgi:hypothetical protein